MKDEESVAESFKDQTKDQITEIYIEYGQLDFQISTKLCWDWWVTFECVD